MPDRRSSSGSPGGAAFACVACVACGADDYGIMLPAFGCDRCKTSEEIGRFIDDGEPLSERGKDSK